MIEFGIARPHDHLSVDVRARVITSPPPDAARPDLAGPRAPAYRSAGIEYLLPWSTDCRDIRIDEIVGEVRAADAARDAHASSSS